MHGHNDYFGSFKLHEMIFNYEQRKLLHLALYLVQTTKHKVYAIYTKFKRTKVGYMPIFGNVYRITIHEWNFAS